MAKQTILPKIIEDALLRESRRARCNNPDRRRTKWAEPFEDEHARREYVQACNLGVDAEVALQVVGSWHASNRAAKYEVTDGLSRRDAIERAAQDFGMIGLIASNR